MEASILEYNTFVIPRIQEKVLKKKRLVSARRPAPARAGVAGLLTLRLWGHSPFLHFTSPTPQKNEFLKLLGGSMIVQ